MVNPLPNNHIQQLAKLLRDDQLVLFVGAGISRQAPTMSGSDDKMPLWKELATRVASFCHENITNYNDNILDLFDAIEGNQSRSNLEDAVELALPHEKFQPSKAHYEISKLPWHIICTTNYDSLLQRSIPEPSPVVEESNFEWLARQAPRRPKLVHLHGTISKPHTLTGKDYIDWAEKHPRAYSFLEYVALNKTILFVGYSFSDPHLKSGILPWIQKATSGRGKRHFAWMWDVNAEQTRLLDKRDSIDAYPIRCDEDWTLAFAQLNDELGSRTLLPLGPSIRRAKPASRPLSDDVAVVNGYKLFFYRNQRQWSVKRLGSTTGINPQTLNDLEQIKTTVAAGVNCFKAIDRTDLAKIEHALDCIGRLEYGNEDDFLAKYIMFYKVNKPSKRRRKFGATISMDFLPDTKVVVFDFGGTLTRSSSQLSTWERMWTSVGHSTADAGHYHRRFVAKQITHQQWCDATAMKLSEKGFSREHLRKIIEEIRPVDGIRETLHKLNEQGTALYIVSGSIKEIIVEILGGDTFSLFAEVKANELKFGADGILQSIKGHQYDFEGKAEFLRHVIREQGCSPLDVLFVGNSLNDSWASMSGVRTLCVNPADVDFTNTFVWTEYIREMHNLTEILPFAARAHKT